MPGLDPGIDHLQRLLNTMDTRVKPAYDESALRWILITPHPRQLIRVIVRIAEQLLADASALHEEADIGLVGHAHAAMHLHAFLHRTRRGGAGARLCNSNRSGCLVELTVERLQRLQHGGAG